MKLEDRVAIVTGAGRNIGEAIAFLFAHEGARMAIADIDRGRASMVAAVVARFGHVDVLVNNVAITDRKTVLELDEDEWLPLQATEAGRTPRPTPRPRAESSTSRGRWPSSSPPTGSA
jgi:NAD(P)-dependent dehydrogenase (short-subunit alcohol dehydrogenase family)